MGRKLRKSDKQKKEEKAFKNKINETVENNYSYYVLIYSIRMFLDDSSKYLKIRNQIENKGKVETINSNIFWKQEYWKGWKDVINRFLRFILKKYPKGSKSENDFKVMNNIKVKKCALLTLELHFNDMLKENRKNIIIEKKEYKQYEKELLFLINIVATFRLIEECVYSSKLKMDMVEIKNIKTIITKYKKYMLPDIMEIVSGN